jgi:hypothetical protein
MKPIPYTDNYSASNGFKHSRLSSTDWWYRLEVLGVARVHGGGKIVIPRYVRQLLDVRDGDLVYFYLDERKRVVLEKSRFIVR